MVVGNEIQKDYASRFSGAVMNCAPVDWQDLTGQMWHTSITASRAKVATCFPENVQDWAYNQTLWYYGNETVDKEWLNWTGGHGDFFNPACAGPSGENESEVVIDWYNAPHPPSTSFTPTGSQTGYCGMPNWYSSGTVDPNGENVSYTFCWGDGTNYTTGFYPSGINVTCRHTWSNPAVYNVTVFAQDTSQTNSSLSLSLAVNITNLLRPLCALKTTTNGYFYMPNATFVNATVLRVEMLFDQNLGLVGDQVGAPTPYPALGNYSDGKVDGKDVGVIAKAFGTDEADHQPLWNYMADVNGDRKVDGNDIAIAAHNFGKWGDYTYIYDPSQVQVTFDIGGGQTPDANGFVAIPTGATNFNLTWNGAQTGAMIVFCGP